MRLDEVSTEVPLDSPERPPAMSYAAVRSSSPACLSVAWDPCVSRRSQARASMGRVVFGSRQRVLCGPPSLTGPTQQ